MSLHPNSMNYLLVWLWKNVYKVIAYADDIVIVITIAFPAAPDCMCKKRITGIMMLMMFFKMFINATNEKRITEIPGALLIDENENLSHKRVTRLYRFLHASLIWKIGLLS